MLGLGIPSPLSVCARLPQRGPLAVEHTGLIAWWHLARVNLLRDMAGGQFGAPNLEARRLRASVETD